MVIFSEEEIEKAAADHRYLTTAIAHIMLLWSQMETGFSLILSGFFPRVEHHTSHKSARIILGSITSTDAQMTMINALVMEELNSSSTEIYTQDIQRYEIDLLKTWVSIRESIKNKRRIRNTAAHGQIVTVAIHPKQYAILTHNMDVIKNQKVFTKPPYGYRSENIKQYLNELSRTISRLILFSEVFQARMHRKPGVRPHNEIEAHDKKLAQLAALEN